MNGDQRRSVLKKEAEAILNTKKYTLGARRI